MAPARILGLILVAVGAATLAVMLVGIGGEIVVAALGVAFLVAYLATRAYGLLIPGAILTGLGLGIVAESAGGPNGSVVLGLGLGFVAIAVVDVLASTPRPAWWWPLIPGGVLTVVAAGEFTGTDDVWRYAVPAVLIAVGVVLLLRHGGRAQPPRQRPLAADASSEVGRGRGAAGEEESAEPPTSEAGPGDRRTDHAAE